MSAIETRKRAVRLAFIYGLTSLLFVLVAIGRGTLPVIPTAPLCSVLIVVSVFLILRYSSAGTSRDIDDRASDPETKKANEHVADKLFPGTLAVTVVAISFWSSRPDLVPAISAVVMVGLSIYMTLVARKLARTR